MRKIISISISIVICSMLYSQHLHIGGGFSMPKYENTVIYWAQGTDMYSHTYTGYGAQVGLEYWETPYTSLWTSLSYQSFKGGLNENLVGVTYGVNPYLSMSVLGLSQWLKVKPIATEHFSVFLLGGPRASFILSQSDIYSDQKKELREDQRVTKYYFSIDMGVGIEYKIGSCAIELTALHSHPLSKIIAINSIQSFPTLYDYYVNDFRIHNTQIQVGFNINLNK